MMFLLAATPLQVHLSGQNTSIWIAAAGIAGTLLAGLFAQLIGARLARTRAREARDAAQMDELRHVLDEAVPLLRKAAFYERQAILASNPTATSTLSQEEALAGLDASLEEAIAMDGRLGLRALEDDLAAYFADSVFAVQDLRNAYIGVGIHDWQSLDKSEIARARLAFEDALKKFVERGRELVGPRLDALAASRRGK